MVTVTANPANLASGVYDGSVLFTPTDKTLNSVALPVTLIVGCGQGGCQLQPTIIAVVNGASFQPGGAPHAIMTIFGKTCRMPFTTRRLIRCLPSWGQPR